ncbi:UbiX family flavin prenyltransferase [Thermodesulfobacteriota bacterium]
MATNDSIIVAVTGASGSIYAKRLISVLLEKDFQIKLIISDAAKKVIAHELGSENPYDDFRIADERVTLYDNDNIAAAIASGTSRKNSMVVIPASMGTTARIACGISSTLIERAADVVIKESGHLVLVPRETPLSSIHLENMLKLSRMGVSIIPAAPAFYHKPESIDDLVDFIITKVLDSLRIDNDLIKRYE